MQPIHFKANVEGFGPRFRRYTGPTTFKARYRKEGLKVTIEEIVTDSRDIVPGIEDVTPTVVELEPDRDLQGVTDFKVGDLSGILYLRDDGTGISGYLKAFPRFHLCSLQGSIRVEFKECNHL